MLRLLVGATTNSLIALRSWTATSDDTPRRSKRRCKASERRPGNVTDSRAGMRTDSRERSFMQWINCGRHTSKLTCQSQRRVVGAALDGDGSTLIRRNNFLVQRRGTTLLCALTNQANRRDDGRRVAPPRSVRVEREVRR